jgi:peroxiredoxin
VDVAAYSPTNQASKGLFFAHQQQGGPRASRHNMVVGNSVQIAVVGVQQRRNASQSHSARLRGANWGVRAEGASSDDPGIWSWRWSCPVQVGMNP